LLSLFGHSHLVNSLVDVDLFCFVTLVFQRWTFPVLELLCQVKEDPFSKRYKRKGTTTTAAGLFTFFLEAQYTR
jgi:hypothetical protein